MKRISEFSPCFDGAAAGILSLQRDDGGIPWFKDGILDPWNHLEAVMALNLCGEKQAVRKGFDYLFNSQLEDGSWWGQLGGDVPFDDDLRHFSTEKTNPDHQIRDTNFAAYIATAVWHDYLLNKDTAFVNTAWPSVEKAINFTISLQSEHGDIRWAADTPAAPENDSLVTGCSSIYKSLCSALKIAELTHDGTRARPLVERWTAARDLLRGALTDKPHRFDRSWPSKENFSMDWYYPVLSGVLQGEAARRRIDEKWDVFVVEGAGCRCVREEPWVTVAETAELVMALVAIGRRDRAGEMFSWLEKCRDGDGAYWMGFQTRQKTPWPLEKPPWTSGAVILAADALFKISPAHGLFGGRD